MTNEDRYRMSAKAIEALHRIQSTKNNLLHEKREYKVDYSRLIFEEYDEDFFSTKVKADSIYYNSLINRLDTQYESNINSILGSLLQTTRMIYEYINIKPKLYGFSNTEILNESEDMLQNKAVHVITNFVNRNYYDLSKDQLEESYLGKIKPLAKDLILKEHISPDDAVRFAIKTVIMESFIEKINFPMTIKDKIQELMESDNYKPMFDQNGLIDLWNKFKEQSHSVAKIVAAVI